MKVISKHNLARFKQATSRIVSIIGICTLGFLATGVTGIVAIAAAENLSKSFSTEEEIVSGNLVSLSKDDDKEVVLASKQNSEYLLGVAVELGDSLLAVNSESNKVQVAISGQAMAIVTNLAGDISTGDFIAQSSINGVGAKAQDGDRVIGVAQAAFSQNSENAQEETAIDDQGRTIDVYVGYIPIQIGVNSITSNEDNDLNAIEKWAAKIAGKPVSALRLTVCVAIAIIGLISIIVIAYSSVKSSIIAAGRNPLAKSTIYGSLAQAMSMTALIAVIAVASMYLVITL